MSIWLKYRCLDSRSLVWEANANRDIYILIRLGENIMLLYIFNLFLFFFFQ